MKVIAFTDLHGNYNLWKAIQNYYNKDDILFCLGDSIDRGPDGIKILKEMMNDERIIYILGNHEDMLLEYFKEGISKCLKNKECKENIEYNGSLKTLKDFQELSILEKENIIDFLENKTYIKYKYINKKGKDIHLSHAGFHFTDINNEKYEARKLLWDRKHIEKEDWGINYLNDIIVHGHTPVQLLYPNQKIQVLKYCNNQKIDLDLGTIVSNTVATLDLDTLEIKYFKDGSVK